MQPDVLGINCATGPRGDDRAPALPRRHCPLPDLGAAQRRAAVDRRRPHALRPHAGRPRRAPRPLRHRARACGIVGGCCGTTPEHIAAVVEAVPRPRAGPPRMPVMRAGVVVDLLAGADRPGRRRSCIIGERTNANGSKAFRDAMLAADWDTCVKMASEQIREGAHVLDVCVDYVGRDGAADMDEIAKRFATQASVPLVLDSHRAPGARGRRCSTSAARAILNSANLEDGELPGSRMDRVFSLARDYGAAVICLLIDERGQARDVEWKMEVAHRIHQIATERYGLSAVDLDLRRADVPAVDRRRRPPPRRHATRSRPSAASRPRSPAPFTVLGVSQRVASGSRRRPATSSTACSCTSASQPGSTRPSCTPARSCR